MFHLQTLLLLLRSQCKGDVFTIFRFLVIPLSEHSEFKKWGSSHLKMKNFSGEGPRTPPPPLFWTQVKSAPGKSLLLSLNKKSWTRYLQMSDDTVCKPLKETFENKGQQTTGSELHWIGRYCQNLDAGACVGDQWKDNLFLWPTRRWSTFRHDNRFPKHTGRTSHLKIVLRTSTVAIYNRLANFCRCELPRWICTSFSDSLSPGGVSND